MDARVRKLLDEIDEMLLPGDVAASELWNVLTALRGPDAEFDVIKDVTTAPIRGAAFPKTCQQALAQRGQHELPEQVFARVGAQFESPARFDKTVVGQGHLHFANHVRNAALELGLIDSRYEPYRG